MVVPLHTTASAEDVAALVHDAGVRILFCSRETAGRAKKATEGMEVDLVCVEDGVDGIRMSLPQLCAAGGDSKKWSCRRRNPDDLLRIIYTSG